MNLHIMVRAIRLAGLFPLLFLLVAGCSSKTPPGLPPALQTHEFPEYLSNYAYQLHADGERNWVLHLNEMALHAMRRGDREYAKLYLDEALLQISDVFGNDPAASRARQVWFGEDAKLFKGDPYERSMTFFYRGILYMQDGDWSNARAAFRGANFQDQFAEEEQHRSDWTIFDYLIAACEVQLGEGLNARETWRLGERNYHQTMETYQEAGIRYFPFRPDELRPVSRDDNLLVIVQTGTHPRKVATSAYGSLLSYRRGPSPVPAASVRIGNDNWQQAIFTDSVYFQATTRGGRYFDHIAGRKVFFKDTAGYASTAAMIAGFGSLLFGANDEAMILGVALIGLAYGLALVSEMINPAADTRTWRGLPDALGIFPASVEDEKATISVRHAGGRMAQAEVPLPPPGTGLSVVLQFQGNNSFLLAPDSAPRRSLVP
ncbi:MAG: hypothetical protein JJU11_03675 [Candidatus Sumerlaeia bacterium]|nr:hypothetical protein [Candidatus Sumerlaeia bacterium]